MHLYPPDLDLNFRRWGVELERGPPPYHPIRLLVVLDLVVLHLLGLLGLLAGTQIREGAGLIRFIR